MSSRNQVTVDWQLLRDFAVDLLRTPSAALQRSRLLKKQEQLVGYIGWSGYNNLGDEVMFDAIGQAISPFHLLQLFPEPGERLLASFGLGGQALFRAAFLGGGTLINPLFLPLAKIVKAQGLPLYTIGTGVGNPGFGISHGDQDSLQDWAAVFRESQFVSVRGPLSEERLRQVGLSQVEVIGDPALALAPDIAPAFRSRKRLIINLSQDRTEQKRTGYHHFSQAVQELTKEFMDEGGEVIGVALGEGDRQALHAFRRAGDLHSMRIEDHRRSGKLFLDTVSGSYAAICVRLHAAVLASCVGVPALLLAYRSKCQDFMSSMGAEQLAVPMTEALDTALIQEQFREVLSNASIGQNLYERAIFWKHKQQQYYQRLSAVLNQTNRS